MNDLVVVVRLQNGEDVIGILVNNEEDKIKLYNPYFVRVGVSTNIIVLPYCYLSDEKYFDFKKSDTMFVVSASESVANRYFELMDSVDEESFSPSSSNTVKGNDTIH